jgi:hypothetical protein
MEKKSWRVGSRCVRLYTGLSHFTNMLTARFQFACWYCRWRGAGKFGVLRRFFPGSQLVRLFPLLSFYTMLAKFVALSSLIRKLLVVLACTYLAFGKTVILYQRNVAGADIATCATLDAVEQAEYLRPAVFP